MVKDLILMRRIRKFAGQVLGREVKVFMKVGAPFGAICHIIYDSLARYPFAGAAFAGVLTQLGEGDEAVGNLHQADYTRRNLIRLLISRSWSRMTSSVIYPNQIIEHRRLVRL